MALVLPDIDVHSVIRGDEFNKKASVRLASDAADTNWTASVTLTYAVPVLTVSALQTGTTLGLLDGVEPVAGDRILLKDAGTAGGAGGAEDNGFNGIYDVTGGTTTTLTLVRAYDLQVGDDPLGLDVWIKEGTLGAGSGYVCDVSTGVVADNGTNDLTFSQWDVRAIRDDIVTAAAASGTDNAIARFDGTTKTIQDSGILISDADNMTGVSSISMSGNIFDANNNELITFVSTGSATSNIEITNTVGGNPIIGSTGPAEHGIEFQNQDDETLFLINSAVGTLVNYVGVVPATTGNSPTIGASGSDANIDFNIQSKGTGAIAIAASGVSTGGEVRLYDDDTSAYGGITVPSAVTTSFTLTLPDGVGTSGQALTTDGNNPAALTWATPTASFTYIKEPCRVCTFRTLTNDGTAPVYSAVGGTNGQITWTTGPTTIDGVTIANDDRILVKAEQITGGLGAAANGVWVRTSANTWDRAADFNEDADIESGIVLSITEGTVNGDTRQQFESNNAGISVGTSALAFTCVSHNKDMSILALQAAANTSTFSTIARIPWDATVLRKGCMYFEIYGYLEPSANRGINVRIRNSSNTTTYATLTKAAASGSGIINSDALLNDDEHPTTDDVLLVQISKSAGGGTNPTLSGLHLRLF